MPVCLLGMDCRVPGLRPSPGVPENTACPSSGRHFQVEVEVEVEVNLRPTVSRSEFLGARHPSATCDQFFFLHEMSFRQLRVYYFVAPSLTRGRALSEQSLLGRSPAELTTIFYCLMGGLF
jgi:hypothetical protein